VQKSAMHKTSAVAALLFVSGLCALVYQTVWMRELRLVFGASTLAGAAVLAIFMGGLGAGAAILGRRADAHPRPLAFYGALECGIALSAAATPFILDVVRSLYIGAGGSVALGSAGATLLRLLLAALVLVVPTFLMGGTLSAAARAAGRERVALLYATNTAGAVAGVLLATFVLLERFGNCSLPTDRPLSGGTPESARDARRDWRKGTPRAAGCRPCGARCSSTGTAARAASPS
jgi:hypothetical protein